MLFEPLFQHADRQGHDVAVIDETGRYTWQQLAASTAGLGLFLTLQTDKPRIGLLLPTGMGFAASFYGTLLAGKCVVPINFLLGSKEIAHIVADSDIDTVDHHPPARGQGEGSEPEGGGPERIGQATPAELEPTFPTVSRRRHGRADVHQRDERLAQGRGDYIREFEQRRGCGDRACALEREP